MNNEMRMRKRQMLESLEYLDDALISGVLKKIKPEKEITDPVRTWRTPLKHWKSIAALAACAVLLAFASPTASFIAQVISNYSSVAGGNAGAGTSELEMPTTAESEVFDSSYERSIYAYPEGMSAEEIYADVLKGGWVVCHNGELNDKSLWTEFGDKVANNEAYKILIAEYYNDAMPSIFLREINFDGAVFNVEVRYICSDEKEDNKYSKTLHFLVEKEIIDTNGRNTVWALVDDPNVTYYEWLLSTTSSDISKHIPWESLFHLN